MQDFHERWQLADARIAINDMGATPAVVSLRLDQAVETMLGEHAMSSYLESTARERIARLFDAGSFVEFLPPSARVISPHLGQLDAPVAFDDGVVVGRALLDGETRVRRRAGRRLHGRRGRRSARRQAGRPAASAPSPKRSAPWCCCWKPAACACTKPTPA